MGHRFPAASTPLRCQRFARRNVRHGHISPRRAEDMPRRMRAAAARASGQPRKSQCPTAAWPLRRSDAPDQQENDRHQHGGEYRPAIKDIDIAKQRGLIADQLADVTERAPLRACGRSKLREVLRQIVQRRLKGSARTASNSPPAAPGETATAAPIRCWRAIRRCCRRDCGPH